ncbi:hypothetical protein EF903_12200 [Streptomyces sp. WAC05292]|uniref:hypothetical protein n=1 Tax=Streptomyces sp. WAC05292 TaxID=2487418 RepID=UPI000F7459DA|nr:hypothetical protein [Streptomyces sp. WAC05292]RSS90688.1 hypothetical protein EF903_12200 [Streptomyces sp. WAC05292]
MPALHKLAQSAGLSVSDLTNGERAVALYVSDMPTSYRFRRGDMPKTCDWILQGAARLGLEELSYVAALRQECRLGWLHGVTAEVSSVEGFSDEARTERAEHLAALVTFNVRVGEEALRRQKQSATALRPLTAKAAA